jgi:two-component system chemotaxis response regulator CheB
MNTSIAVISPDERMRSVVETIIKADASLNLLGVYSNAVDAIQVLENTENVVVVFGLGGDSQTSLKNLKMIQVYGPFPVLGIGDAGDASPALFDAFRLGMLDFIPVTSDEIENPMDSLSRHFTESVNAIAQADMGRISWARLTPFGDKKDEATTAKPSFAVVLGVPRCGLASAVKIMAEMAKRDDTAIFASLPIPEGSVEHFIGNLEKFSAWPIRRIKSGEEIVGGICYASSISDFVGVEGSGDVGYRFISLPKTLGPIDKMMDGVSDLFGRSVIGVLLEGIGRDGIRGLGAIKSRLGTTVTLKEGGGVLTLTPEGAIREGAAHLTLDIEDMPDVFSSLISEICDIINLNMLVDRN